MQTLPMMKCHEVDFNVKGKKAKCSGRREITYDPVILLQGQFCIIIVKY